MDDKLDQAPGAQRRAEPDRLARQSAVDDVEGHSIQRGDGVAMRRDVEPGEGFTKRNAIPDDGDDVEGHAMLRGDDGAIRRDGDGITMRGGDDITRKVGPGEGIVRRD